MITKLAWNVCYHTEKLWVKMIRAKYLRGVRILDAGRTRGAASWVWSGIRHCFQLLRAGACIQIGARSLTRIKGDPWIQSLPKFRIPDDEDIPPHLLFARDLMNPDGVSWNRNLILSSVPQHIGQLILKTPILEQGQERLIWTPSTSGIFLVKSTYRLITQHRGIHTNEDIRNRWKLICNLRLHGRHLLLLWKMLNNALPTLDKISKFMDNVDNVCYLCQNKEE